MRLRKRLAADLPRVIQLLASEGLPPDGLEKSEGWVFELEGRVIGHIAVEPTAEAWVVRSLVVSPEQRGRGLGEQLLREAEQQAQGLPLVLRTKTVGPWVERLGYRPTILGELPASVRATTQFAGDLCSGTPAYSKAAGEKTRPVRIEDASAIAAIYNPYITDTIVSFEEEPVDAAEMEARIRKVTAAYPWIVWEEGGQVLGYAYASSWRARHAYRHTVETSLYVDQKQRRRGIGENLYRALILAMCERGFHSALGCLSLPNDPSVALHEKLGFTKVAQMKEAGLKFNRWVDVGFWELML